MPTRPFNEAMIGTYRGIPITSATRVISKKTGKKYKIISIDNVIDTPVIFELEDLYGHRKIAYLEDLIFFKN